MPNRGTPALVGLLAAAGWRAEVVDVRRGGALPPSDDTPWVLGGGPGSPADAGPWREPLLAALRHRLAHDLPTLAICFGFEMLGAAAGGELRRLGTPREGVCPVVPVGDEPLLAGLASPRSWESRHWGVWGSPGTVFARGPEGDQAGIRYSPRVVGVIFHPEADLGPDTAAVYGALVPRYLASLR